MTKPLWECPGCGKVLRADVEDVDEDTGIAYGPECDEYEEYMEFVKD